MYGKICQLYASDQWFHRYSDLGQFTNDRHGSFK